MIDLGLTSAGTAALLRTLLGQEGDRIVTTQVQMLDLDHNHLGNLFSGLDSEDVGAVSGQVNIDSKARPTRQLQLQLVDPEGALGVDTEDGRPRLDRMIRVHYTVWVGNPVWDWVAIPIFTGPISSVSREGEEVSIEAQGKEAYASGPTWKARTFSKGRNRVNVVRVILSELTGESRFRFPHSWPARLAKPISMGKQSSAWTYALHVTSSMNAQLFYDGRGTARIRKRPVRPAFTFRDGDGGTLLSKPRVSESNEGLVNAVRVTGATAQGKKNPRTHTEFLPSSHMYSPYGMRRGGRNKYYPEEIEDDTLRSQNEVRWKARRRIKELSLDQQVVEFRCLPIPMLEEDDPITIDASDVKATARVTKMSIPIGHEGESTVGFLAPLSTRKKWRR